MEKDPIVGAGKLAIWKFPLTTVADGIVSLQAPWGARALHVAEKNGSLCLWALVDPKMPNAEWKIKLVGTGFAEIEKLDTYIGTALLFSGALVIHAFEVAWG